MPVGVATGAEAVHLEEAHVVLADQVRHDPAEVATVAGIALAEEPIKRSVLRVAVLATPAGVLIAAGGREPQTQLGPHGLKRIEQRFEVAREAAGA